MKKSLVVIKSYANNLYKHELLVRLIKLVKDSGREILVSSHYPLPANIQESIDYYIYDFRNPRIDDVNIRNWINHYINNGIVVSSKHLWPPVHEVADYMLFRNTFSFIKENLDYDYAHFFNYDQGWDNPSFMDENEKMIVDEKLDGIFVKFPHIKTPIGIEGNYMYLNVDEATETFPVCNTPEDWVDIRLLRYDWSQNYEQAIYNIVKSKKDYKFKLLDMSYLQNNFKYSRDGSGQLPSGKDDSGYHNGFHTCCVCLDKNTNMLYFFVPSNRKNTFIVMTNDISHNVNSEIGQWNLVKLGMWENLDNVIVFIKNENEFKEFQRYDFSNKSQEVINKFRKDSWIKL